MGALLEIEALEYWVDRTGGRAGSAKLSPLSRGAGGAQHSDVLRRYNLDLAIRGGCDV